MGEMVPAGMCWEIEKGVASEEIAINSMFLTGIAFTLTPISKKMECT